MSAVRGGEGHVDTGQLVPKCLRKWSSPCRCCFFLLSRAHGLTIYYTVSGSGSDVERAATGSLDNLAIRVAVTGSLLLDGIFSLLLVNYNEDVGFFFFGLKCRKAKSGALSKTVAVPIEDTRGNPSHSNHSATSSQDECCSSLMSAAPAHFNVVLTAFRLWLV